jgi:hypothetical protein
MGRLALCVDTRGWADLSTDSSDVARSPYPEVRVWLPIALIGSSADVVRGTNSIIIVAPASEVKALNADNPGRQLVRQRILQMSSELPSAIQLEGRDGGSPQNRGTGISCALAQMVSRILFSYTMPPLG